MSQTLYMSTGKNVSIVNGKKVKDIEYDERRVNNKIIRKTKDNISGKKTSKEYSLDKQPSLEDILLMLVNKPSLNKTSRKLGRKSIRKIPKRKKGN